MSSTQRSAALALCLLVAFAGCAAPPATDLPVLEERSLTFLADGLERTEGDLTAARERLAAGEGEAALARLENASSEVRALQRYFLPVLNARELAHRAQHAWTVGQADAVGSHLAEIETLLTAVSADAGAEAKERLREPLSQVQQIELALDDEPDAVVSRLAELERQLNNLVLKGQLVVATESGER